MHYLGNIFKFIWKIVVGISFGVVVTYLVDRIFGLFEK